MNEEEDQKGEKVKIMCEPGAAACLLESIDTQDKPDPASSAAKAPKKGYECKQEKKRSDDPCSARPMCQCHSRSGSLDH